MTTLPAIRRSFKATVLNPVAPDRLDIYSPGFLTISGERIEGLSRQAPSGDIVELQDRLIVPGFVDTHVHLAQYAIMGIGTGELLGWLHHYTYPEEARFQDIAHARSIATAFFQDLIANGTTTASIYVSIHEPATDVAFTIAQQSGIRAFIGKVMMDQNAPPELLEDTASSLAASRRLFEKWDGAN